MRPKWFFKLRGNGGSISIMTIVIFMSCCVIVIGALQIATLNLKMCFWDYCSLQADQAAQSGLVWARHQLDEIPADDQTWVPMGSVALDNGAQATVSSIRYVRENGTEYLVTSTGTYRGAKCRSAKSFFVPLPAPICP